MNKSTIWLILFMILLGTEATQAQRYSLQDLLHRLDENHPFTRQGPLIQELSNNQISNNKTNWYPQLAMNGQATYQSAVSSLLIKLPGIDIPSLPKDQYKITMDVNQLIYDGGINKAIQNGLLSKEKLSMQQNKTEVYNLKQQVVVNYLNILLARKQLHILDLNKEELELSLRRLESLYLQKMALLSQVNQLKIQLNQLDKKKAELSYGLQTLLSNLSFLTSTAVTEVEELKDPEKVLPSYANRRPELAVFGLQKESNNAQIDLVRAKNNPKLNFFITGGYGRPGLNFLSPEFEFYYLGGVKANLPLYGFYTQKRELQNIKLQNNMIDRQIEAWQIGIEMQLNQNRNDREKYQALLSLDETEIELKEQVAGSAKAQFIQGFILAEDYTTKLNDLEEARLNKSLHEIQLLQAKINYKFITGNL